MGKGTFYIISGPSGAGKSTVLKKVIERDPELHFSISATTRAPRAGEEEGVHYHFLSRQGFEDMIASGDLLEYAEYVGNYYGTPAAPVLEKMEAGISVLTDIDVQGARQVMEKMPRAVSIFLLPPSLSELELRLGSRGTDHADWIAKRLAVAAKECAGAELYDYIVINDDLERAAAEILAIMTAQRCRRENRIDLLRSGDFCLEKIDREVI